MLNEKVEKRREFIINTVYIAIIALIVFACFKYVAKWIMPFIIGFIIAFAARPAVSAVHKVTRLNKKLCGFLVIILEYVLLVFVIWALGSRIYESIRDLFLKLPDYYDSSILPFINSIALSVESIAARISPETLQQVYSMLESFADNARGFVISLSTGMLSSLAGMTKSVPFFLISFVFTILASVFITMDYRGIVDFLKKQLPPKTAVFLSDAKQQIGKTVLRYLRAYLIIFLMTFTELSIGLSILGIENSIGLAAIIAVADVLPVIGTGGVLIPWAIWGLLTRNFVLAIGLVILYVVILVVRNFTEPKIVGDQLGLNPVVTLIAIYLGYRLLGVAGMIGLPIFTTILVGLHKSGKIKLWKE